MAAYEASAPGKLVILGEYAVLDGHPALVMAVDRRARAEIGPADTPLSRLETRAPEPEVRTFAAAASGVEIVDLVAGGGLDTRWQGVLDTTAFFAGDDKLGLGSSAAALCAWAGAWRAFAAASGRPAAHPSLDELIGLHRRLQGGGSGVDVAACLTGGVLTYRRDAGDGAEVGSVRLPNSVGFAGIFAGRSASTPGLVARYREWSRERPSDAADFRRQMGGVAEVGCAAARSDDARGLLDAIADYGRGLDALGRAMGADIMTPEHGSVAEQAQRFGVVYKVSGAGGGDLGLAFSDRPDALAAFRQAVTERGFGVVDLHLDAEGLVVKERLK